jgi:hypothetical protein
MKFAIRRKSSEFGEAPPSILTSSWRCTARGRFLGRRGGRAPRMARKSAAISSLVSATEKPLFRASTGGDARGCCACHAAAFPAPSDPAARGAAVAERRVRRFHGRGGWDAPTAPGGEADVGAPSLEQRRRRCVPQLSVGKVKSWRRVRVAGAADDGDGDTGSVLALALGWWWPESSAAMRIMRGGCGRRGRRGRLSKRQRVPRGGDGGGEGFRAARDCFCCDGWMRCFGGGGSFLVLRPAILVARLRDCVENRYGIKIRCTSFIKNRKN